MHNCFRVKRGKSTKINCFIDKICSKTKDENLNKKIKEAEDVKEEVAQTLKKEIEILEKLSGLSAAEAKEYL